jgi:methylase of polypeptide subunit release factors
VSFCSISRFVSTEEFGITMIDGTSTVLDYVLADRHLLLEVNNTVFQPTLTSKLLGQALRIPDGASVLELGCGVGGLAILAVLLGASHVDAVDVMPEARPLVIDNARRNGVSDKISAYTGDIYSPIGSKMYDVIISDVSGVVDEVSRLSPWYPDSIPTGGYDGADQIVKMLDGARSHLNPGGVLYYPTGTISSTKRTLDAAQRAFGERIELIEQIEVPFCQEFKDNMDVMTRLKDEGLIEFSTRRSRHLWTLQIYRCWT